MFTKRPELVSLIAGGISFVPYLLLAWAASKLLDDTGFWTALVWLLGLRLFFGIVELIGASLSWRIYGKRASTEIFTQALRETGFPKRYDIYADAEEYFGQVVGDESQTQDVKIASGAMLGAIKAYRTVGLLVGMRIASAWEGALEAYSPLASFVDPDEREDTN